MQRCSSPVNAAEYGVVAGSYHLHPVVCVFFPILILTDSTSFFSSLERVTVTSPPSAKAFVIIFSMLGLGQSSSIAFSSVVIDLAEIVPVGASHGGRGGEPVIFVPVGSTFFW